MSPATRHRPTARDYRGLARLAGPIVLIQLGMMSMGVVDTVMVGRVSAAALAAVALANLFSFGIMTFGLGVLMALDPIISQALGARDHVAVSRGMQRGFVIATVLILPISLLLLTVDPVLRFAGQPDEVIPLAAGYVYRTLAGVWPFYVFVVLRQTLQAHRRTAPIVATILAANLLNGVLNYGMIFGHFGLPAMGVLGSAWATLISRWCMAVLLLVLAWPVVGVYLRRRAPNLLEPKPILRVMRLGTPIGAQMLFEFGAFAFVALLMGRLGVVQVAAHQVAINLASLTFMVPLGVSSAAAVVVGHAVGRQDPDGVRRATAAALHVGAAFMAVTGVLFIGLPSPLARLYTDEPNVVALAAVLLPIAGVFQIFDGLQVVALGLLRGLGDTRVPMLINVVAFWLVAIPVSLGLGFGLGLGATGLWWGLVVGLAGVAVTLVLRLRHRERRDLERIVIDDHATGLADDATLVPSRPRCEELEPTARCEELEPTARPEEHERAAQRRVRNSILRSRPSSNVKKTGNSPPRR